MHINKLYLPKLLLNNFSLCNTIYNFTLQNLMRYEEITNYRQFW